jgi:hypothetical protein
MTQESPTSVARALAKVGKIPEAESAIKQLIASNFSMDVTSVKLNYDWTSLNSLNGMVQSHDGE